MVCVFVCVAQGEPNSLERHIVTIEAHEARMAALSTYLDALDSAWLKAHAVSKDLARLKAHVAFKNLDLELDASDEYNLAVDAARVEYDRKIEEIRLLGALDI